MGDRRLFKLGTAPTPADQPPGRAGPRRTAQAAPVRLERPGHPHPPTDPGAVAALQRAVGNRAVTRLLTGRASVRPTTVQRQPPQRTLAPQTQRWEVDEPYRGAATTHRTTRIEASGWAEVGPSTPRISYHREVELTTADGITVYLDIRGTVYLNPGTALPTGPQAALDVVGRLVRTQRTLRIDGGDVIAVNEYSPADTAARSLSAAAGAALPDYAQLPLTVAQQEAALLALLKTLPRKAKTPTDPDDVSTVEIAANIATDFIPIIGELKDLYRAIKGRDPVTGEKLAWWERVLAFIGAIPLLGKVMKATSRFGKLLSRAGKWLGGRFAGFGAWLSEKFERWMQSRRARRLAKAQSEARRLVAAESEVKRLAEARRLARTITPTLEEVQRLVPPQYTWKGWGEAIWGIGAREALGHIGTRSTRQLLELGVNRDVATALYNWYRAMPAIKGGATRLNRMALLEHIIGLF